MGNRERCVTVLRGVWRRVFGVYGVYGFGGDEEREREKEKRAEDAKRQASVGHIDFVGVYLFMTDTVCLIVTAVCF